MRACQRCPVPAGRENVFSSVQSGSNVTVPIPSVDRGRADPRHIIGVVTCTVTTSYTQLLQKEEYWIESTLETNSMCVLQSCIHPMVSVQIR